MSLEAPLAVTSSSLLSAPDNEEKENNKNEEKKNKGSSGSPLLVDLGCGVGNALIPILESQTSPPSFPSARLFLSFFFCPSSSFFLSFSLDAAVCFRLQLLPLRLYAIRAGEDQRKSRAEGVLAAVQTYREKEKERERSRENQIPS